MGRDMVGRLPSSLGASPSLPEQIGTRAWGFPPEFSRPCDPRRYRALYPDMWFRFLRAHFQDATAVAYFFGVDSKTAREWWEGITRSQGWAVSYAIESIPTAREYLRAA